MTDFNNAPPAQAWAAPAGTTGYDPAAYGQAQPNWAAPTGAPADPAAQQTWAQQPAYSYPASDAPATPAAQTYAQPPYADPNQYSQAGYQAAPVAPAAAPQAYAAAPTGAAGYTSQQPPATGYAQPPYGSQQPPAAAYSSQQQSQSQTQQQGYGQAPYDPAQAQAQFQSQTQYQNQSSPVAVQGNFPTPTQFVPAAAPAPLPGSSIGTPSAAVDSLGLPIPAQISKPTSPAAAAESAQRRVLASINPGAPPPLSQLESYRLLEEVPPLVPVINTMTAEDVSTAVDVWDDAAKKAKRVKGIDLAQYFPRETAATIPWQTVEKIVESIPTPVKDEKTGGMRVDWSPWHTNSIIRRATPPKQDIFTEKVYSNNITPDCITFNKCDNFESSRVVAVLTVDKTTKKPDIARIKRGKNAADDDLFPAVNVQVDIGRPGFQNLVRFRHQCCLLLCKNGIQSKFTGQQTKPDELPSIKYQTIWELDPKVAEQAKEIKFLNAVYEGMLDILYQYRVELTADFNLDNLNKTLRHIVSPQLNGQDGSKMIGKPDLLWTQLVDYTEGGTQDGGRTTFYTKTGMVVPWVPMTKTGFWGYPLIEFARIGKPAADTQIKINLLSATVDKPVPKTGGTDQAAFRKHMFGEEAEMIPTEVDDFFTNTIGFDPADDYDLNKVAAQAIRAGAKSKKAAANVPGENNGAEAETGPNKARPAQSRVVPPTFQQAGAPPSGIVDPLAMN